MSSLIPKVGETYNTFDDGKISPSRMYQVTIKKVIPFNEIDKETLNRWKEEVKEVYWLYNKETDYFVICEPDEEDNSIEVFVRTTDNRWFSFSDAFLTYSMLDVDGDLYEQMKEYYEVNNE